MRRIWGRYRHAVLAALFGLAPTLALAQTPTRSCPSPAPGEATLGDVRFVSPSAYLSGDQLAEIAGLHASCARRPDSVEAVLEAVNLLYAARGIELAYADFAGLDGAQVLVELIEIRVGALRVQGAQSTSPAYLRRRAGLAEGDLADLGRLTERLGRLPETDDIRVDAQLIPGSAEKTTDIVLTVTEPPRVQTSLVLDNTGAPASGRMRLSGGVSYASLTGLRDPFSLNFALSEGTRQLGFGYSRPVGDLGTRVSFGLSHERTRNLKAAAPLNDLVTEASQISLGVIHPMRLTQEATDRLVGTVLGARDKTVLAGLTTTRLETVEVGIGSAHMRRFEGRGVVGVNQTLRLGRVRDKITGTASRYTRHDGSLFGVAGLSDDWSLGGELRWQWASATVPPVAQFSATGRSGVRGYGDFSSSDDAGALARIELRRAAVEAPALGLLASPSVFYDVGRGASHAAGKLRQGPLRASVGLSVDLASLEGASAQWSANVTLAKPLRRAGPGTGTRKAKLTAVFGTSF